LKAGKITHFFREDFARLGDFIPVDKSKPGAQDRTWINVNEDCEVRDWAKTLGVSPDELKKALRQWEFRQRL
jgi:hypothetical protein